MTVIEFRRPTKSLCLCLWTDSVVAMVGHLRTEGVHLDVANKLAQLAVIALNTQSLTVNIPPDLVGVVEPLSKRPMTFLKYKLNGA